MLDQTLEPRGTDVVDIQPFDRPLMKKEERKMKFDSLLDDPELIASYPSLFVNKVEELEVLPAFFTNENLDEATEAWMRNKEKIQRRNR